jgi:hypothetical protein
MDRDYLTSDDRVKSRFEDLLAAVPEVQVTNLFERVGATLAATPAARAHVYRRYARRAAPSCSRSAGARRSICSFLTEAFREFLLGHPEATFALLGRIVRRVLSREREAAPP